jgi:hypothetical protein
MPARFIVQAVLAHIYKLARIRTITRLLSHTQHHSDCHAILPAFGHDSIDNRFKPP